MDRLKRMHTARVDGEPLFHFASHM